MRRTLMGLAVAMALASSCGPKAQDPGASSPSAEPSASARAALDPCGGMFHAVCADKQLADLGDQMKSALASAASTVSPKGLEVLSANERTWLESQRVACGLPRGATSLSLSQASCLRGAFAAHLQNALTAVEKHGPFLFQRVEIDQADKVAPSQATRLMGAQAPKSLLHSVLFPRIDGDDPIIEKFNDAVRQAPRFHGADQTEESTTYELGYVGPDLVSVRFDKRDLTIGAAHPNASMDAVTFNMRTGALLASSDVFRPNAPWQDFLARRAAQELTKQLQNQDETARPIDPSDLGALVAKPSAWFITDDALVLLFPAGALAPTATDAYTVAIPWRDLRPYLNRQGPGPIRAP